MSEEKAKTLAALAAALDADFEGFREARSEADHEMILRTVATSCHLGLSLVSLGVVAAVVDATLIELRAVEGFAAHEDLPGLQALRAACEKAGGLCTKAQRAVLSALEAADPVVGKAAAGFGLAVSKELVGVMGHLGSKAQIMDFARGQLRPSTDAPTIPLDKN